MNRILFEKDEVKDGCVRLRDFRSRHILGILHGETGQKLKTGIVDGGIGESTITDVDGDCVTLSLGPHRPGPEPWVDILLAPPRPRVMKRLFPQLAAMGAGTIVLAGAKKVEKDFWGATMLKEENLRPLLVEGLMQAGTAVLPRVELRRNFRRFMEEELDAMFPGTVRVVGHPSAAGSAAVPQGGRKLLAVGPEGGWTEGELEMMRRKGFAPLSLGERILKTETAAIALLSKLME